jgi:hypothetical protein
MMLKCFPEPRSRDAEAFSRIHFPEFLGFFLRLSLPHEKVPFHAGARSASDPFGIQRQPHPADPDRAPTFSLIPMPLHPASHAYIPG